MSTNIDTLKAVKAVGYIGQVYTLKREYGETPNGNPISGRWVLRKISGEWVDFDQYRNNLCEEYPIALEGDPYPT